jgi:hypothetical protein
MSVTFSHLTLLSYDLIQIQLLGALPKCSGLWSLISANDLAEDEFLAIPAILLLKDRGMSTFLV